MSYNKTHVSWSKLSFETSHISKIRFTTLNKFIAKQGSHSHMAESYMKCRSWKACYYPQKGVARKPH